MAEIDHARNCPAWFNGLGHEVNGEDCTCGLQWRNALAAANTRVSILETENRELHIKLESCQRDLSAISAGFTAANTRIAELAKFTFHGLDCDIYRGHFGSGECTCGLGKLITPPAPSRAAEKESI